ncbi:gamma-glutamylcyclotransferase family protein [Gordoniibacillus kamchatkensis]|uniref:gamma-glutamylcyclotransferase family protein n=1 Tax=Gordoniibacillus kamchatkensis TaxID=1590651 RepID=UPI00069830E4|nr:gamma-glutamylcyclotransferase family protein [Paenibacillus sp. VKM B-2647]
MPHIPRKTPPPGIPVFVYGTLLPGECNHRIVAPHLAAAPSPGAVRGRLYDAGEYPGLVPDDSATPVEGAWLYVRRAGLAAMDELEDYYGPGGDNDYERIRIRDADGAREGWTYVWLDGRGYPLIAGGSWRKHRAGIAAGQRAQPEP